MQKLLIALVSTLCLLLGCQSNSADPKAKAATTPSATAPKGLSKDAKQELAAAESYVQAAKDENVASAAATDALKKAKDAAAKEDSAETQKQAKLATEEARNALKKKLGL